MSGFAPLPRLSPGNLTTVCLGVIAQHFACNSFMGTVGCDVKGIDPMGRCQIDNNEYGSKYWMSGPNKTCLFTSKSNNTI